MIIIDLNQVMISNLMAQSRGDVSELPDKDAVRESLQNNDGKAPKKAHLQRKFSLTYNLRKRLRIGI